MINANLDFESDIKKNYNLFKSSINKKNILIIGGAGTIGSNYTKEILRFEPSKIVIYSDSLSIL